MRIPLSTSEGLTILGMIISGAMAYGAITAKVNAQDEVVKTVPAAITRIVVLETKLDYLIELNEYSLGLRRRLPSKTKLLGLQTQ